MAVDYVGYLRSKVEAFHGTHDQESHGNWATDVITPQKNNSVTTRNLHKELWDQGLNPNVDPMFDVVDYVHGNRVVISRDTDGKIKGALSYNKSSSGIVLNQIRVSDSDKKTGRGTALMRAAAQDALTIRGTENQTMTARGTVQDAVPFHQKLGAVFHREINRIGDKRNEYHWNSTGHYDPAAVKALAEGHPTDRRVGDVNDDSLFDPIYGFPKNDNPYAGEAYDRELRYYYEQKRKQEETTVASAATEQFYNECHDPGTGEFCTIPGTIERATPKEAKASKALAKAKVAAAPVPTKEQVKIQRKKAALARKQGKRAGGESRGNSTDRRARSKRLFSEWGGDEKGYIVCPASGVKMHWSDDPADNPKGYPKFHQDKIFTNHQGGGYRFENLLPVLASANAARNDRPIRPENTGDDFSAQTHTFHSCDTHDCKDHGNWASGGGQAWDDAQKDAVDIPENRKGTRPYWLNKQGKFVPVPGGLTAIHADLIPPDQIDNPVIPDIGPFASRMEAVRIRISEDLALIQGWRPLNDEQAAAASKLNRPTVKIVNDEGITEVLFDPTEEQILTTIKEHIR